jgi:flagella basal body P-ring formation protein FlgA
MIKNKKINKGQLLKCNMVKKSEVDIQTIPNYISKSQTLKRLMSL